MTAAAAQASRFLEERTTRSVDRFVASLAQAEKTLKEKLGAAVQVAEQNVAGIDRLWAQTHWGTMRATVRRNGQWATRGIRIDLAEQLAKPLLDTVAFAWVDLFGDRALQAVDAHAGSLNDAAADYIDRFELSLRAIPALTEVFERHGAATAGAAHQLVQQRLNELKRDVNERLTTNRRRLNDDVLDQVRLLMERTCVRRGGGGHRIGNRSQDGRDPPPPRCEGGRGDVLQRPERDRRAAGGADPVPSGPSRVGGAGRGA